MSTFLQLVNDTRIECAASGAPLLTLLTGLNNESQRFKTWVNEAWMDLQRAKPDWDWMRKVFAFDMVAGQATYTLAQSNTADLREWKFDSLRSYETAAGTVSEQVLPFMTYDAFRNVYQFGGMRVATGNPAVFTVNPDKTISIGPLPDRVFTVTGEYYRVPVNLVGDGDTPTALGLPEHYHRLIVYMAMQSYAAFYAAPEVLARAADGATKLMSRLEFDFLPVLISGPPLA